MIAKVFLPAALFASLLTTSAHADLRICNDTSELVGVAVGYRSDTAWMTEGWWRIPAESCTVVIDGDLASRYLYLHGEDASGKAQWLGRVFMCTSPKEFKITGLHDCFARGFDRTGFFEVDTRDQKSWQVRFSDIGAPATSGAAEGSTATSQEKSADTASDGATQTESK